MYKYSLLFIHCLTDHLIPYFISFLLPPFYFVLLFLSLHHYLFSHLFLSLSPLSINFFPSPLSLVVDCGSPPAPSNGGTSSTVTSTTFNTMVSYVCDTGFILSGTSSITCQASGQWSGEGPTCTGQPEKLQA